MKKRLFIQISFIFFTLLFSIFFFNLIFKNKDIVNNETDIIIKPDEKNLIEGIQYFSKDFKGNTYLIEAASGIMDKENQDIINLENVKAKINFDENNVIEIFSNKAIYNINNYDTEFSDNVNLNYKDNKLTCEKILAKFSENYAILKGNLIFKNFETQLYADQMEVDLISRTTKTSMFNDENKIKIKRLTNGIN